MPLDDSSADTGGWRASTGDISWPDQDVTAADRRAPRGAASGQIAAAKQPAGEPAGQLQPAGTDRPTARFWDPATCLIAVGVATVYTVISVFRYLRRDPTSWDLGIFTEYVKQYADLKAPIVDIKGAGFDLLGDHFHPIVALIAPFFRLFPTSATLLVAQALLAGISVLPVSQLGRELLGPAAGRCVAAAYGLSWGLQQMANYDFHEIAFSVPLLAFSLSAMVRGRMRTAVLWALPLVFVKEDQGFTVMAIGLLLAFAYRRYGAGLLLECWGLGWSLLAIMVIIPHFNPQHCYAYWGSAGAATAGATGCHLGAGGLAGLWRTFISGAATKLPTLALILLPTAFIALRSPVVLAAVPSLVLRAVDNNPAYWGTDWHYNATVMPIVFIAAIDAIARIRASRVSQVSRVSRVSPSSEAYQERPARVSAALGMAAERYGAAAMLAICAALAFQFPLSSLWTPATYELGPHVAAENQAMSLVPNGATVSTDLDLLAPLASRTDTFWLGNWTTNPPTEYVVFDTESTDWQPPPANVPAFVKTLEHGARYRQIYLNNGVYVFRRIG